MSEQHCPEGTCPGCYGCECLDNPDCFTCNDRRETRMIERERIIALLIDETEQHSHPIAYYDNPFGYAIALIKGEN